MSRICHVGLKPYNCILHYNQEPWVKTKHTLTHKMHIFVTAYIKQHICCFRARTQYCILVCTTIALWLTTKCAIQREKSAKKGYKDELNTYKTQTHTHIKLSNYRTSMTKTTKMSPMWIQHKTKKPTKKMYVNYQVLDDIIACEYGCSNGRSIDRQKDKR